jgi:hypothetical protein
MKHRAFRRPSNFAVHVRTEAGLQNAKLIDVNSGGARLLCEAGLSVGQMVVVIVMNHKVTGHVRWSGGGRAGISFTPQLTSHVVDTISKCIGSVPTSQRYDSSHLQEMR